MMSTIGEEYEVFWREKPKALGEYLNDKHSTANPKGESNVETDSSRSNNGPSNSTIGSSQEERRS